MAGEWTTATLGRVSAPPQYGAIAKGGNEYCGPLFIRQTDIISGRIDWTSVPHCDLAAKEVPKYSVREGDVLVSRLGAGVGNAAVVVETNGAVFAGYLVRFQPNPELADPRFIGYHLQSKAWRDHVHGFRSGAAQPTLNAQQMGAFEFDLPPIAEQRAITHILGTLDDKIELNRRMSETLEAMARALFKSWFVDFDPVRAKVEGRQPSGMDAETAKVFPSEFEESELGLVPKGWAAKPLAEWVSALSGGTPSKSNNALWGGDVPWISPKVMTEIHADEADAFVTPAAVSNGTRMAPAGSTLVMVRGMGLHQKVRVSQARREVTFNQDVKALVPQKIEANLLLFALLHAQEELLGRVESSGHGTGKLPSEILLGHRLTMPPLQQQELLADAFAMINDRIDVARNEARTLGALRDELLPRLLSGELCASGADVALEQTA